MTAEITIIGGGLAGCEAAWQLLRAGLTVRLFEQRPVHSDPAHVTDHLAELVCSNSLRSDSLANAAGLLKAEMRLLDSLIIAAADAHKIPAGSALAVDREGFYRFIRERLESQPEFTIVHERVKTIPRDRPCILASGPLTDGELAADLAALLGQPYLYFYDAIAPIVEGDSIDMEHAFWASRWDRGDDEAGDYLNCPLTREEYLNFIEALRSAEQYPAHDFEDARHFEGCLPIEEMAARGEDVLRFGPLKPVGLADPRTGKTPYAVLQLRKDDAAAEHFNLVGCQTKMRQAEQKRVLRMIPALARAEFARLGQMHRNSFVNAPKVLEPSYRVRGTDFLFLAGQISGVEGYIESAASGLAAGRYLAQLLTTGAIDPLPPSSAIGALGHYIAGADEKTFQPMNVTFGLLRQDGPPARGPRRKRREGQSEKALAAVRNWIQNRKN
jgi:methylenetetrahydrofolate--tRNA-(uracil-5-)-methyltransferase